MQRANDQTRAFVGHRWHGVPRDRLVLDQIAALLGGHTLQRAEVCGPPKRGLEQRQKLRADEMLRAHLTGNITTKELAAACCLSPNHFGRCFRPNFGTSVHQRLIQLRIEHAKHALLGPNQTLAEIALLSGFCDQAAFSRAFSRIEHMTAKRHAHRESHPVIASFERDERGGWCYADEAMVDLPEQALPHVR